MASPVVGLAPLVPVQQVVALLRQTNHNGFPVLAPAKNYSSGSLDDGGDDRQNFQQPQQLLGTILRSQLLVMLERGFFCDSQGIWSERMVYVLAMLSFLNCTNSLVLYLYHALQFRGLFILISCSESTSLASRGIADGALGTSSGSMKVLVRMHAGQYVGGSVQGPEVQALEAELDAEMRSDMKRVFSTR